MALTQDDVKNARPRKGRRTIWDKKVPGFGLRVYPTGKKSFIAIYKTKEGRQRLKTWNAEVFTVKQARERAKALLVEVSDGNDPVQADRDARDADPPATFAELADRWVEDWAREKRRAWDQDVRRLEHVKQVIGRHPAEEVTPLMLTRLHHGIGRTRGKVEANRVLATIRTVFEKAKRWRYLPADFDNPASGVQPYKEKFRTRTVRHDEFPALLAQINAYPDRIVAGALLTLVFSGLRKKDVLNLRWADVDLAAGSILLRTEKTGEIRMVPISQPVRSVLTNLPRFRDNEHVFPGHKHGRPLASVQKAWERIRERAGCPDLWIHDLKRTVGTWLALAGENPFVIQQVLGHRHDGTAKRYVQLAAEMTSGVMDRFAKQVEDAANTPQLSAGESTE